MTAPLNICGRARWRDFCLCGASQDDPATYSPAPGGPLPTALMTTSLRRLAGCAAALLTVSAATAHAQAAAATRPVSVGITGGLTIPTGDFGDGYDSGYNVGGLLEFAFPLSPLSLRINGEYQSFKLKDEFSLGGDNEDFRIISGTADLVYKLPGMMVRPYVLGGVGLFNGKVSGSDGDSENKFGFNLGGGLEIPLSGITVFGDARYQSIQTEGDATNLVPIRVGIRF
jgi:opacity protein-like surface antigen